MLSLFQIIAYLLMVGVIHAAAVVAVVVFVVYMCRQPFQWAVDHAPAQPFEDDEYDSGYREAENFSTTLLRQSSSITDVKSAADASSRAAVAASAAAAAVAVTKVGGCVLP